MIAFPGMLVEPAKNAGIKIPDDPDNYEKELFPHWHVFVIVQLGAPMPFATAHWENAKIIAQIPEDKITTIGHHELEELGIAIGRSY